MSQKEIAGGRWTDAEHRKFLEGLSKYGKDWKMI
jgi:SHAQKYF class myb-like DNA-binding protein